MEGHVPLQRIQTKKRSYLPRHRISGITKKKGHPNSPAVTDFSVSVKETKEKGSMSYLV